MPSIYCRGTNVPVSEELFALFDDYSRNSSKWSRLGHVQVSVCGSDPKTVDELHERLEDGTYNQPPPQEYDPTGPCYSRTVIINGHQCPVFWGRAVWNRAELKELNSKLFEGSITGILVYSVASKHSFETLRHTFQSLWKIYGFYSQLETSPEDKTPQVTKPEERKPIMIVAADIDLPPNKWEVSVEEGRAFAHDVGAEFGAVSAKDDIGIHYVCGTIVAKTRAYQIAQQERSREALYLTEGQNTSNTRAPAPAPAPRRHRDKIIKVLQRILP